MAQNIVTLHYTLRDPAGRVLDMSQTDAPISYLEGAGQIIDGLEEPLRGVAAGTKQKVQVPAAKAYGLHDPTQVHKVNRTLLPVAGEVHVGDQFRTEADHFAPVVTVVGMEGDDVLLDANHPLAGVDLTFDVEIVAVRPATPEDIERMQNPGAGCSCRDGASRESCACNDSEGTEGGTGKDGEGEEGCACSDGEGKESCTCNDAEGQEGCLCKDVEGKAGPGGDNGCGHGQCICG
jgi:FKBP-type peptidyl-prolyl cis-trans isomerase SlyD